MQFDGEQSRALLDCYERYLQKTERMIRRTFPLLSGSAEDLAQEAFLRTARACHENRLKPDTDMYPYLWQTAKRLAIDILRGVSEQPASDETLHRLQDACDAPIPQPDDPDYAEVLHDVIRPAIAEMRPTQRRTVVDLQSQGMEDEAISAYLQVPKAQVSVQRCRAVAEIQAMDSVQRHSRQEYLKERRRREGERGERCEGQ
ncbi:sigma-70 family RNA polymerase sigma factor [Streptomyces sp. MZ04]|uniref:RNA polymerase sigma factor n=1 Tax=Streptomyces sp. MZ04 TaxID=2559236 RepID=UPI0014332254|nr:sigma-70 family RNA polymerase sigma factor [Streptomyces sp. MZ04]